MVSMNFTFPVNSTDDATQCLNVTITDDVLLEGNETLTMMLALVSIEADVIIGNEMTAITITDNEGE